jgi:HTH-type transcriptional regulator/antitoxin HigA
MAEFNRNQYVPESVSPPGATLEDTLLELGMSQSELASRMGRPKKTINEIIKGKASITADTALQLEKVLGVPASFWTNRERLYREHLARRADAAALARYVEWARPYPVAWMLKHGWIAPCPGKLDRVQALLRFFGIASPDQLQPIGGDVRFRKRHVAHQEPLQVWLRRGEIEAQAISCTPFDRSSFERVMTEARAWTLLRPDEFQHRIVESCAQAGVAAVFVPELPGCGAHGVTRWLSSTKALLQLSLRYKTNDQLWFMFFHEAEHILRHGKSRTFIEGGQIEGDKDEIEADGLAGERLIPPEALERFLEASARRFSEAQVAAFARQIGIAPGIVVGRLQHDKRLPFTHLNHLKVHLDWATP